MANRFEQEEQEHFFLPSEFLTFDDILFDNNFKKPSLPPSELPFDFTQNSNEAARLSDLTRQLKLNHSYKNYEKSLLGSAGSPQSTLSHFGCLSGRSSGGSPNGPSQTTSPPIGSAGNSWDLIYQAAAEISKLKLNGVDVHHRHHSQPPPPGNSSAFYQAFVERVREEQMLKKLLLEKRLRNAWLEKHAQDSLDFEKQSRVARSNIGAYRGNEQVGAWGSSSVRQQNQESRTISRGVSGNYGGSGNQFSGGVKKQSSGTGVFLPRSYGSNNNNNAMKSSCLTTPILGRGVPGLDGNFSVMGSGVVQPPGQTRFLDGVDSDFDLQLAKMKLLLMQKRQLMGPGSFRGNY